MKAPDGRTYVRTATNSVMTVTRYPNFWSVKLTLEVRKIKVKVKVKVKCDELFYVKVVPLYFVIITAP